MLVELTQKHIHMHCAHNITGTFITCTMSSLQAWLVSSVSFSFIVDFGCLTEAFDAYEDKQ